MKVSLVVLILLNVEILFAQGFLDLGDTVQIKYPEQQTYVVWGKHFNIWPNTQDTINYFDERGRRQGVFIYKKPNYSIDKLNSHTKCDSSFVVYRYRNDTLNGFSEDWCFANGTKYILTEVYFTNGIWQGASKHVYDSIYMAGNVVPYFEKADSSTILRPFDGRMYYIQDSVVVGPRRVGLWEIRRLYDNQLLGNVRYVDGKYNGEGRLFWENGKLKEKRYYKNDKLNGEQIFYDIKGAVIKTVKYIDGVEQR